MVKKHKSPPTEGGLMRERAVVNEEDEASLFETLPIAEHRTRIRWPGWRLEN